jgi:hypothetical protein
MKMCVGALATIMRLAGAPPRGYRLRQQVPVVVVDVLDGVPAQAVDSLGRAQLHRLASYAAYAATAKRRWERDIARLFTLESGAAQRLVQHGLSSSP